MGWTVADTGTWIDVDTHHYGLHTFRRDEQGLREAEQFRESAHHGQDGTARTSVAQLLTRLSTMLERDREAGRVNTLTAWHTCQRRRKEIDLLWERLQTELRQIKQAIDVLPALPLAEEIRWAQTVLAMNDLTFMEIDTTGLRHEDEITRFTLLESDGEVVVDLLLKPTSRQLSAEASAASGIRPEQLERGLSLADAWVQIQDALAGRYVISFAQEWDVQQLHHLAEQHQLEPVLVIGDCLQRHATRYYHGEYYLKLEELCARVGSPLPAKPHQTSIDRAQGQRAVLQALAHAITDVRPPKMPMGTSKMSASAGELAAGEDYDPFLDTDDLS